MKRPELRSLTTRMSPMTFTPELDLAMGSRLREPKGSSRLCSLAVRRVLNDAQRLMDQFNGVREEGCCDCDRGDPADEDR